MYRIGQYVIDIITKILAIIMGKTLAEILVESSGFFMYKI